LGTLLVRVLGFCAALAAFVNVTLAFHEAWTLKQRVDQAEEELARVKEHNLRTQKQIDALQTSPAAVETVIRMQNQLKPGEEIVRPAR
jgi:hypothetical protein